jgi:transposase-like protein
MLSILGKPYFRDEAVSYARLESIVWPHGLVCVHCGETNRIGLLKRVATRPGLCKCYACCKQFRVTMNTVFKSSHIALRHWLQAVYLMMSSKKGVSSNQIHRTMDMILKIGWFMTMEKALAGIVGKRLTRRLPGGTRPTAPSLQART